MKYALLLAMIIALGGCAAPKPPPPPPPRVCPKIPPIGVDETLKIYIARIIDMYDKCASTVSNQ